VRTYDSVAIFGYWAILVLGVIGTLARAYFTLDQTGFRRETLTLVLSQTAFDLAIVIGLFVIVRLLIQRRLGHDMARLDDEDASD
jgi:hypothetical protein